MGDSMCDKDEVCKDCYYEERSYTVTPCNECSRAFSGTQKDWYEHKITATPSEFKQFFPGKTTYVDKLQKEDEQEFLTKLIDDHWAYIEKLLVAHDTDKDIIEVAKFHYKSSGFHFWKHAMEYMEGK